jgi:Zn-dependent protease
MSQGAAPAARCPECRAEVAPGLLACPGCARLVHGAELAGLAAEAQSAERAGDLTAALGTWRRALALLPPGSAQQESIHQRMVNLSASIDGRGGVRSRRGAPGKAGAAAGAGAVGLALLKSKALLGALLANGKLLLLGLLKLPTLLSMLFFARFWTSGGTGGVVLGVVGSLYVHEMGHVAALRRYGIESTPPMFIPGFGALVRLNQYPTDAHEEARTGLAGPLWGLFAAGVAAALGKIFGWPAALAVASWGASVNLFNLIPFWQLDGARGLRALSRGERFAIAALGILACLVLHQWMPGLVGAAAAVHAFGAGGHPTGDRRMLALFAALIVLLGLLASLPGGDWRQALAPAP